MKATCQQIQDALIDQLLGQLPGEQRQTPAGHIENCPECRRFQDFLTNQDQILSQWGKQMQDRVAQKAENAARMFLARNDVKPKKPLLPLVYYAAAAVLIAAALFGLLWPLRPRPDLSEKELVGPGIQQQMEVQHPQGAAPALSAKTEKDKRTQAELQIAQALFDEGDVTALAALYKAGTDQTRQAVLNYLAQIGTEEALRAISDLTGSGAYPADPNRLSEIDSAAEKEGDKSEDKPAGREDSAAGTERSAQPKEQDYYDPEAVDADNWQTGVLGIRVVDDKTGKPIRGANLKFDIQPKAEMPKQEKTNQFGRYELMYYNPQTSYLRVEIRKPPYVGIRLSWNPGDAGGGIPLQYQVRMKEGVLVGGIIETVEGQPLEGVKVDFSVYLSGGFKESSPLIEDQDLMTDAEGRWELAPFPADLEPDGFGVSVEHPEYVSVERYSIHPELDSLLNKGYVIKMQKGLTVRGQVTNREGRPIEGARVYTGSSRYDSEKKETHSDANGMYTFSNCKAYDLILTVTARGYAPEMREITVRADMEDVNFQLEAGYSVTVHVIDQNGNGVGGVKIEGDEWRTYGAGSQDARTIRCGAQTDATGFAALADLPADEVRYTVRKEGYASYNTYPMTAGERDRYEIMMLPEGKLTGRVLDGETGSAIGSFYMTEGIDWDNKQDPTWQGMRRKLCTNGLYEQKLYYQDLGLAVQIEAEGYLSAESHAYINDGTEIVEDMVLFKGQGPGGVVYLPDGQFASGAEVRVRDQDHFVNIENGRFRGGGDRTVSARTDEEGRFQLPAVKTPYCLVVLHEAGGAIVSHEEFASTGAITLQSWSTVEGMVYLQNKPAPEQTLALHPSFSEEVCGHISVTSRATTDENGKFSCGRLFSGRIQVSRMVPLEDGSSRYVNTAFVQAESGQTVSITMGQGGRTVTGRIVLSGDMKGSSAEHIELNIQRKTDTEGIVYPEMEIPENYFVMTQEEKQQWQQELMQTEVWKDYLKRMQESQGGGGITFHESVIVESDGMLRAENIPPGTYVLSGQIGDPKVNRYSNEWYQNRLGTVNFTFSVPDAADETDYEKPVELGTIPIDPIKILRIGQGFPAVDLEGLDGDPIHLSDYHGSYVLLDFGFVMVSENPGEFADILKTLCAEFHKSRQFEVLSVWPASGSFSTSTNDSYRKAILYFLQEQEIPWSAGMFSGEMDVLQELASSGIYPSLLLVDPAGNVAALNIKPEELKETLNRYLSPDQDEPETP